MDAIVHPSVMSTAAALCVVAAVVHLLTARHRASRLGHAVMLAAMVALAFGMDRWPVLIACLFALAAVGGRLLLAESRGSRVCAVDAVGCAVLVGVAALSLPSADDQPGMAGMAGTSHLSHAPHAAMSAMGHAASYSWPLLLAAVVAGIAWAVLGRAVDRSRSWIAQSASGVMIGGMAVMALQ